MPNGLLEKTEMDYSPHSMNTAYVPSTILRTVYIFLHLVPTTIDPLKGPFPQRVGDPLREWGRDGRPPHTLFIVSGFERLFQPASVASSVRSFPAGFLFGDVSALGNSPRLNCLGHFLPALPARFAL